MVYYLLLMPSQMLLMITLIASSTFSLVRMKLQLNKARLIIHHLHTFPACLFFLEAAGAKIHVW